MKRRSLTFPRLIQEGIRSQFVLLLLPLLFVACAQEAPTKRERGIGYGKADGLATCFEACGAQGVGGCYCDEACESFGDCCPDYELLCTIQYCTPGDTTCIASQQYTCDADAGTAQWSAPTYCENGCTDGGVCERCDHECPEWGAFCSGDRAETCVVDDAGCRRLIAQDCELGCTHGVCNTCSTLSDPLLASTSSDQTRWERAIAAVGDTIYTAWSRRDGPYTENSSGLARYDISTSPYSISLSEEMELSTDRGNNLKVQGDRMFVSDGENLDVYDVKNPQTPTYLGGYNKPSNVGDGFYSNSSSLSVDGDRACLATTQGVLIFDIETDQPTLLGQIDSITNTVVCRGDLAVLAPGSLQVWNVSDPTTPQKLAQTTTGGYRYTNLDFDGTHILAIGNSQPSVTDNRNMPGLEAWRFSAPATLERVGRLHRFVYPFERRGNTLVFGNDGIVGSVDISDLSDLKLQKVALSRQVSARAVTSNAGKTYVADDGVGVFDLARIGDVQRRDAQELGHLLGTAQIGNLMLEARLHAFVISDIREPNMPVPLSTMKMAARGVQLVGSTAWVAAISSSNIELHAYNIANPKAPKLLGMGKWHSNGSVPRLSGFRIIGNRGYAICEHKTLCIFDVSNPSEPTLIVRSKVLYPFVGGWSSHSDFDVIDNYLAVTDHATLHILDIEDPNNPIVVASMDYRGGPGGPSQLLIAGHHAFVLRQCPSSVGELGSFCIESINLAQPEQPTPETTLAFKPWAHRRHDGAPSLMHDGNWLVVNGKNYGISMIDISDPGSPQLAGDFWTAYSAFKSYIVENAITVYTNAVAPNGFLVESRSSAEPMPKADQTIQLCQGR